MLISLSRLLLMIFSLSWIAGCANMHPPLQTELQRPLRHIEVAAIEYDNTLKIRRMSPLTLMMGSSGLVLDNIMVAAQGYEYKKKIGDVGIECGKIFKSTLIHRLREAGYEVHDRNEPFWNYFKPSRKAIREQADGILRIQLEQVGFWANGLNQPYRASALVMAEMIDPRSRETLYRNRFVIGLTPQDVRMLKDFIGTTQLIERGASAPEFKNFDALLEQGEESRFDLLNVVALAARRISDDLRPSSRQGLLVAKEEPRQKQSASSTLHAESHERFPEKRQVDWQGLNPSANFLPISRRRFGG